MTTTRTSSLGPNRRLNTKNSPTSDKEDPSYWRKKHNLTDLREEFAVRGILTQDLHVKSKRDIANILTTFDKTNCLVHNDECLDVVNQFARLTNNSLVGYKTHRAV